MVIDYSNLTGQKMIKTIKRKNCSKFWERIVYTLITLIFVIMSVAMLNYTKDYVKYSIRIILFMILTVAVAYKIPKIAKNMLWPEKCRLFRTQGTPDEIAARIVAECQSAPQDEFDTLICQSFIMTNNDFESFMSFKNVRSASLITINRTYKSSPRIVMHIKDIEGVEHRFSISLSNREQAEEAVRKIQQINQQI